jgi:predicted nucleic acid-binding protein
MIVFDPLRLHFLDASVLVKLVVNEEPRETCARILSYFNESPSRLFRTTSVCLAEALGVLKTKWLSRKELTQRQYDKACYDLITYLCEEHVSVEQPALENSVIFGRTREVMKKYNLDLSDAFQIVTVSQMFQWLASQHRPVLVTADDGLARAAKEEGLLVWDICRDPTPPVDSDTAP